MLRRAQSLGFLGPGPIEVHREQAARFAIVEPPTRALDLGSGGGVPGLALALMWPASRWVLLDANQRRGAFLSQAVADLGLGARVEVAVGRAEEAARSVPFRGTFDLVTARSFGRPAVTAECGSGFLTLGGRLLVSEPPEDDPGRWPSDHLVSLGLRDDGRSGSIRVLTCIQALDQRFPRRVGVPGRRPLWE